MPILPRPFFRYVTGECRTHIMPPTMFQPRALATSFAVMPASEGLVQISGKGKLLDAFLCERKRIPFGRTALVSSRYNVSGKQVQRRSKYGESLVKRWGGVKSNAVSRSFARSSFWSLHGADVSGCRGLCTSRVKQLSGVLNVAVEAGEVGEEATVAVDQDNVSDDGLEFAEAAFSEAEGNGEIGSVVDKETDEIVSEVDTAGNAKTLGNIF